MMDWQNVTTQWQTIIAAIILALALLLGAWIVQPVDRYFFKFSGATIVAMDRATGEMYVKTLKRGTAWKKVGDAIP